MKVVEDWFKKYIFFFFNFFFYVKTASTVDLIAIEHLRDVMEREIRILDMQPINPEDICNAIITTWTQISNESFQSIVKYRQRGMYMIL